MDRGHRSASNRQDFIRLFRSQKICDELVRFGDDDLRTQPYLRIVLLLSAPLNGPREHDVGSRSALHEQSFESRQLPEWKMKQLDMNDVELVSGAGLASYAVRKLGEWFAYRVGEAVLNGEIDYAGVAESQGTYYNTVGA